jgi:hydroxymethylglutaryl-CoA synthase
MEVGIVSYGTYFPGLRITRSEYLKALGSCGANFSEKTVADFDEDTLTMGIAAAKDALAAGINPQEISLLTWASTSPPYSEKLLSGSIAEMLGLKKNLFSAEYGQSTRAGGEAFLTAVSLVKGGFGQKALVIVADAPRANVKDPIEHGLAAGSAAFILGTENLLAVVDNFVALVQENLGERFRKAGSGEIKDIGVKTFTGEAYQKLITKAITELLEKENLKPADYNYAVLHEIESRLPLKAGKKLGFTDEQMLPGLLYENTGDTGAASPFLSLAAVLDRAKPGEKVIVATYGSGAGVIAFSLTVKKPANRVPVREKLASGKKYLNFIQYLIVKRYL